MAAGIERVVTTGTFTLDGGEWEVENNVWLVGDDETVVVIDAAHDPEAILGAVAGRHVPMVICTHGHNDHINAAVEVAAATEAQIALHPADHMLWEQEYGSLRPDVELTDGASIEVAGIHLAVLHTPGHSPGSVSLYSSDLEVVFSGDTLFNGGPGATGRSYSDFDVIIASIRQRLLTLPLSTVVRTGHGEDTSIRAEEPHLQEWLSRGH